MVQRGSFPRSGEPLREGHAPQGTRIAGRASVTLLGGHRPTRAGGGGRGRRAILNTHQWLEDNAGGTISTDGGPTGGYPAAAWAAVRDRCNLVLVLSGHNHSAGGERSRVEQNDCGDNVYMHMADYQSRPNGGNGWLRHLTFTPAQDELLIETYSPLLAQYEADANSRFVRPFSMPDGAGTWAVIGAATAPGGSGTASVTWSALGYSTVYQWYVEVRHGTDVTSTQATPWSFTTRGPPPPVDPVVVSLSPLHDAMVLQSQPTLNQGASNQLSARGINGASESFLRFALPAAPAGRVLSSAVLSVRTSTDPTAGSVGVFPVTVLPGGSWSQSTVTWDTRPTGTGAAFGSLSGASATNSPYQVAGDAAALSGALGTAVTLRLGGGTTSDNVRLWSQEATTASYRPVLTLTFTGTAAPDTAAPSVPAGVSAVLSGASAAVVTWQASTDDTAVAGYDVYRGTTSGFAATGTPVGDDVAGLTFTSTGLAAATTYYFKVVAFDAAGNRSAASAAASMTTSGGPPVDPVVVSLSTSDDAMVVQSLPTSNQAVKRARA